MRGFWLSLAAALLAALACAQGADAQKRAEAEVKGAARRDVRAVTIPVTVRLPEKSSQSEVLYLDALQVFEDGDRQEILATRGAGRSPMTLAILIQDDLVQSAANEIKGIADFIRRLPPGSRVMVAYLRSGVIQVRQKFTGDLERAAKSLRIPVSSSSFAPYSPFDSTREALTRFASQPVGRRAVLLIDSDTTPDPTMLIESADAASRLLDPLTAERIARHAVEHGGGRRARWRLMAALANCTRVGEALALKPPLHVGQGQDHGIDLARPNPALKLLQCHGG